MQVIKDALSLRARNDSASPLIAPKFMVRPCTELNLIVTNEQEQSLQNTATVLRSAFSKPQHTTLKLVCYGSKRRYIKKQKATWCTQ